MKKILSAFILFCALGNVVKAQNISNQDVVVVFTKFSTSADIYKAVEQVKQQGGNLEITHCQRKRNGKIRSLAGKIVFPNGCSGNFISARMKRVILKSSNKTASIRA